MTVKINLRLISHILFWAGILTLFWQYFEFAYKLYIHGIIISPLCSGTFGCPILHHGYFGFIAAIIAYILITKDDYIKIGKKILHMYKKDR